MMITKIMMIRMMETDGDLGAAVMTRESWSQLALRQPPVKTQTRADDFLVYIDIKYIQGVFDRSRLVSD